MTGAIRLLKRNVGSLSTDTPLELTDRAEPRWPGI